MITKLKYYSALVLSSLRGCLRSIKYLLIPLTPLKKEGIRTPKSSNLSGDLGGAINVRCIQKTSQTFSQIFSRIRTVMSL